MFTVPDGTRVAPLFNSSDIPGRLPLSSKEGISIAMGEILPGVKSKIHVHPLVKQVTCVLEGKICIYMKDCTSSERYRLELTKDEAVLTEEGTFFQLVNESEIVCRVLYIVNPEFLFETADGSIIYNDAVVLERDWQELQDMNWQVPEVLNSKVTPEARNAVCERIANISR